MQAHIDNTINPEDIDMEDHTTLTQSELQYNSVKEILVVDDNPNNLKLIHALLALNNYKVRLAKNGSMALRSASSNPPSLILLDITMPEMDGFEICHHLKHDAITKDIPVIFLSALKEEFDIVKGFKAGAVDFVTKPFKSEVLLSRVRTHLTIDTLRKKLSELNNSLESEVQDRTKTIDHVYKLSQSLTEEIKIKPLFEKLLPILLDNCDANYACIIQKKNNHFTLKTSLNKNNSVTHHNSSDLELNESLCPASIIKHVEQLKQPYYENKINHKEFEFNLDHYFDIKQPNAILCFPIHSKSEKSNIIYLEIDEKNHEFNEHHIQFIEILMSQVSIAIENATFYNELEQKVEERTLELKSTQDELMKSERLATLGKLTASVAHELRHPLGTIRSSTYALQHKIEDIPDYIEKILQRIERNVHRCDDIISEMLEYTREKVMQLESISLEDWLPEIFEELHAPEGISFELILNPVPLIEMDPERFRRVIINLFNNACQAMSDPARDDNIHVDSMSLTVEIKHTENTIMIIFTDTGPGIPDEIKNHIFEPLYSTKSFGVGLGLPIVKQIINKHKGSLEIESAENNGTKVICTLPVNS